jgi:hypothetical protein
MAMWDSTVRRMQSPYSHPWLAQALSAFDAQLRRRKVVFEYTRNPSCIFRLEVGRARRALALADGTRVRAGARVARLHFWNEQIPPLPPHGATIGWARRMQAAIALSLRELARYLAARPDCGDIAVICADVPSATGRQRQQLARIMTHYGFEAMFEAMPKRERLPLRERLHRYGENVLISLIVYAHNAGALRADTLARVRLPIYLSRRILEKRFTM